MSFNDHLSKAFNNLDLLIAYLLVIGCTIVSVIQIVKLSNPALPIILALFSIIYLVSRNKVINIQFNNLKGNFNYINNLIFLWGYILAILLLFKFQYPYGYVLYFFLALIAISIIISIFYSKDKDVITLLKIILLVTVIRASFFYAFPGNYGLDVLFHSRLAQEIVNSGHLITIQEFLNYSYYPVYHIFLANLAYFTNISINNLVFIVGIIQLTILNLVIYSMAKLLKNKNLGLIACFIFSIMAPVITAFAIPNFFGLTVFAILILVTLKERKISFSILFIIGAISLIYTHPYPPINLIFILIAFYLTLIFAHYMNRGYSKKKSFLNIETILLTVVMFVSYSLLWGQNAIIRNYMLNSFMSEKSTEIATSPVFNILNVYSDFYYYIIMGLAILGVLLWLNQKEKNFNRKFIAILNIVMIFGFFAIGILSLAFVPIPYRILPFLFIVLSISVAQGIIYLYGLLPVKKAISRIFIVSFLTIIFCLSITSVNVSPDLSIYSGELNYRTSMNTSEAIGLNFVEDYSKDKFSTDSYSRLYIRYTGNLDTYNRFSKNPNLIIVREYLLRNSFLRSSSNVTANKDIITIDEYETIKGIKNWNIIYDNGNVWTYRKGSL